MEKRRRILVLSDTPDFGGHERAFLALLPGLLESEQVECVHIAVPEANGKLREVFSTQTHPKLSQSAIPFIKGRGEPYIAPFRLRFQSYVKKLLQKVRPDVVLLLQGRIENLCTALIALPRNLEVVSYIPMGHSIAEMGLRMGTTGLPDLVRRFYYSRPNRYIAPSNAVARQLKSAGATGPIFVASNVVGEIPSTTQEIARRQLGLETTDHIACFMGRFDVHQKGLDVLCTAIDDLNQRGWHFLFVGTGPGERQLRASMARVHAAGACSFIPWLEQPHLALRAADALLMPSRYEGVPLVMLEAMSCGLPILGSPIDVFQEHLPNDHIVDFADPHDLWRGLRLCTQQDAIARYRDHVTRVLQQLDLSTSQRAFTAGALGG